MANYPIPGNSEDVWGTDLATFTTVSFEPSGADGGKLKTTALDGRNFTGTISFSGATVVGLPASTSIGTISAAEISYLDNASSNIQNQIGTHTSATSAHGTVTALVGISDTQTLSNKTLTLPKINSTTTITVSGEEINYVAGVVSNIQTQIDSKSTSTHTHALTGGATDVTATYVEINQALDGISGYVTANTLSIITSGGDATGLHSHSGSDISSTVSSATSASDSDLLDGQHGSYYAVAADLTTHTSATSAHGTATALVGISDTQILTNKTLTLPKINSTTTITVSGAELNHLSGITDNIQTQINSKASTPPPTFTTKITPPRVAFPATQSASSDANTLDDYEEGTFTVTLIGNTTAGDYTFTGQNTYTKIGQLVTVQVEGTITVNSSGSGYIKMTSLPFNKAANTSYCGAVRTAGIDLPAGITGLTCTPGNSALQENRTVFWGSVDDASTSFLDASAITTGDTLTFAFSYIAA